MRLNDNQIKICFLTHNLKQDNGAGVFSLKLIDSLKEALGAKVIVLTTESSGFYSHEQAIIYPEKIRLLKSFPKIRRLIKDCDYIHALDVFPYGVIAILTSLGLRKKLIITAIGSGSIMPLYKLIYSWLSKYSYRKADAVTAISRFTQQEILKKVPDISIRVINPGVDFDNFNRPRASFPQEMVKYQPYILSVGSLRWRKGYKFSIPAFAKVSAEFPKLKYVIIGKRYSDKFYEQMKSLVAQFDLSDRVFFLEDIDDREKLIKFYQGAELFCLFSQTAGRDVEGFGLVFLEAAASGLPVVGSRNSGVEDAVRDGVNGFLAEPRDINGFAQAIIRLLKDLKLKEVFSKNSLEFARSSSWDRKIEAYIELYKKP